jgi:non-specific serine/threonine protein kinase
VSQLAAAPDPAATADVDPVDALFHESLEIFGKLDDVWGMAACLSGMGNRAFARGDFAQAAAMMQEGLELARTHGDAWQTSYLLHGLGHVCWMLGRLEQCLAFLGEGLLLSQEIGDRRGAPTCLQSFALIAGSHGLWDRATRLWGAAAALRQSAGLSLWGQPWIRSREGLTTFDAVDAARAAVGEAAFMQAWSAGGALSLEEAVAEALALRPLLLTRADERERALEHDEPLTPREREVAALVARGLTNRQIGEALVITEGTAALHVKHILAKLSFSTRSQIAAWASRRPELSSA